MDGLVTVYSEPGMGATFNIYLPLIKTVHESLEAGGYKPLPRGKERILFVDDEVPIVQLGRHMLETLGYQVTAIENSQMALQAFRAQPQNFDLVITDMSMPRMTGVELAKALLSLKPNVPIILCTGFSEIINRDKAKAIGIREYIMKPIIKKDMANVVRKVLDQYAA
jgi:CheY-like chemotaxis protein